ncbi:MAG: glycoside hydrolase family 3 N-terminal domain-containing protein, partial [Bacillota bacterium]|nr:glycoside hydrolase family 3 N-terminal domain-containing protein [Bacillota bacterium]
MLKGERYEEAKNRAEEMLSKMNLTEKIGQISQFGTSIYTNDEQVFEDHFVEGKVGSYLTIKGAEKTNHIQEHLLSITRLKIPALFAEDVIHGYRTTAPTPLAQSCTWEPELAQKCCEVAAKECYSAGIKWTFAPMVDIARDPRWGRIVEGYGEDTYLCCDFAKASVKGFQGDYIGQKDHVLSCMKHYAAYGACIGGRDYNSVDMSLQTLHDVYLPSFKAGIDAGAATVMSAFNDVNGVPCTGNKYLLRDVLRDQFGFK